MTPIQAYELAKMFSARRQSRAEFIAALKRDIAAPQEAGPAGERALRGMQQALGGHEVALAELHAVENDVRRILGLEASA